MKLIQALTTLLITLTFSYAQPTDSATTQKKAEVEKIFQIVENMPEFPGGQKALNKYLSTCPYPAAESKIEGTVYIRFVVEEDGKLSNFEVAKGADKKLNDVAFKHVKKMPDWKPGYQNGKPVRVQYIVPINFNVQENKQNKK